jgi:tetratricopeptide (TPR) repeat protein
LPSFGFFIAFCAGILYPAYKKCAQTAQIMLFGLVAVYSILTFSRNRVWKTEDTLWSDAIEKGPSVRAYNNRGDYYYRQKKYDKALSDAEKALRLEKKETGHSAVSGIIRTVFRRRQDNLSVEAVDPGCQAFL